jgi:hypothetical protein
MTNDVGRDPFRALCVLQQGRNGLSDAVEHMLRAEAPFSLQPAETLANGRDAAPKDQGGGTWLGPCGCSRNRPHASLRAATHWVQSECKIGYNRLSTLLPNRQILRFSGGRYGGGETGIRTLGTLSRTHAFQACALSRSAISPASRVAQYQTGRAPQTQIMVNQSIRRATCLPCTQRIRSDMLCPATEAGET